MLKINHLSFTYQKDQSFFKDFSLQVNSGSLSLLSGPTGCGKSTLLKLMAGIYPQFGGQISDGQIQNSFKQWGMVFQDPDKQFAMQTPYQEFIFTLENLQLNAQQAQERIALAAKETNTQDLLERTFTTLSGGEKQRVALAIIIAMDCDLILLDEPFASCDPANRKFLMDKLIQLKQAGKTIIISDHHLSDYRKICDQVLLFDQNHQITNLVGQKKDNFLNQPHSLPQVSFDLPQNQKAILDLKNFSLKQGNKILLKNQNLPIFLGHATLLSGTNGSGKTSLFRAITRLIPYEGQILFQGKDINKLKRRKYLTHVSQAFQNATDQFLMITVREEIELSQKLSHKFTQQEVFDLLKELQLDHLIDQVIYSLSGGQKKKLQLLLMILASPDVLLLDEPFAGLDHQSIIKISNLFQNCFLTPKKTLLIISHQIETLDQLCDYHLKLENQQLHYTTGGIKE